MVLSLVGEVAFSQSIWAGAVPRKRPLSDHVRLKARLKRSVKSRPVGVGEDQRFGGELGDVRQGRQRQERGAQEPKAAQRAAAFQLWPAADLARFRRRRRGRRAGLRPRLFLAAQEERGRLPAIRQPSCGLCASPRLSHLRLGPARQLRGRWRHLLVRRRKGAHRRHRRAGDFATRMPP